jgi:hypothetical protein
MAQCLVARSIQQRTSVSTSAVSTHSSSRVAKLLQQANAARARERARRGYTEATFLDTQRRLSVKRRESSSPRVVAVRTARNAAPNDDDERLSALGSTTGGRSGTRRKKKPRISFSNVRRFSNGRWQR